MNTIWIHDRCKIIFINIELKCREVGGESKSLQSWFSVSHTFAKWKTSQRHMCDVYKSNWLMPIVEYHGTENKKNSLKQKKRAKKEEKINIIKMYFILWLFSDVNLSSSDFPCWIKITKQYAAGRRWRNCFFFSSRFGNKKYKYQIRVLRGIFHASSLDHSMISW